MIDPAHLTDAELAAWYGSGLHAPKAQRLIEEVRRLRRELNDERVRNQHDRDLARDLSRLLAEVEIHNGLAEDELEVELAAKRELIVERDALAEEAAHLRARLAEVEAERDEWNSNYNAALLNGKAVYDRMVWLEARLSAVLALCDQTGGGPDAWLYVVDVLAAARGEGDRPAETGAERYLKGRLSDPDYRAAYERANAAADRPADDDPERPRTLAEWKRYKARGEGDRG